MAHVAPSFPDAALQAESQWGSGCAWTVLSKSLFPLNVSNRMNQFILATSRAFCCNTLYSCVLQVLLSDHITGCCYFMTYAKVESLLHTTQVFCTALSGPLLCPLFFIFLSPPSLENLTPSGFALGASCSLLLVILVTFLGRQLDCSVLKVRSEFNDTL